MTQPYIKLRLFYPNGSVSTLALSATAMSQSLIEAARDGLERKPGAAPLYLVEVKDPVTGFWVEVNGSGDAAISFDKLAACLLPDRSIKDARSDLATLIDELDDQMRSPAPQIRFRTSLNGH